jgi:hypothetical protein
VHSAATAYWCALNQGVLQTLMIPLAMVMRDKLRHRSSDVTVSDRNDPVETFFLHRSHEPLAYAFAFGASYGVRTTRIRSPRAFAHGDAPLRIPVANQHAAHVTVGHRKRSHDLAHKRFVRMGRSFKHLHAAGREINDEHRVERHEASPRPHLSCEEIGPRDRSPMRSQKRLPRRRALRRWGTPWVSLPRTQSGPFAALL